MKSSTNLIMVRAIPLPGHQQRFRAGIRWTEEQRLVRVVEGTPDDKAEILEITPAMYAELKSDPRIAVTLADESGVEAEDVNLVKARVAQLEDELTKARGDLASANEERDRLRQLGLESAEKAGAKIAQLENELDAARADLASRQGAPGAGEVQSLRLQLAQGEELHQQSQTELASLREQLGALTDEVTQLRAAAASGTGAPAKGGKRS